MRTSVSYQKFPSWEGARTFAKAYYKYYDEEGQTPQKLLNYFYENLVAIDIYYPSMAKQKVIFSPATSPVALVRSTHT